MKIKNNITTNLNEPLKIALQGSADIYTDIINNTVNSTMDDETNEHYTNVLNKVNGLSQLEKDILFLYAQYGATKTAQLLQITRGYVHILIKKIKEKLQ